MRPTRSSRTHIPCVSGVMRRNEAGPALPHRLPADNGLKTTQFARRIRPAGPTAEGARNRYQQAFQRVLRAKRLSPCDGTRSGIRGPDRNDALQKAMIRTTLEVKDAGIPN